MAHPSLPSTLPTSTQHDIDDQEDAANEVVKPSPQLLSRLRDYVSTLRPISGCSYTPLYLHNNCYIPETALRGALLTPHLFRPKPSDVLLSTTPKSGTTWLKALLFTTVHRHTIPYSQPDHPLTLHTPHELVPLLEFRLYATNDFESITPSSHHDYQVLATHLPLHLLPQESLRCRIIYLCRDAKDCFVSLMHFLNKLKPQIGEDPLPMEEGFEAFCNGASLMGPYWDSIVGYWEMREKVFFLKYEEMMEDPVGNLRRIAEFIGRPFTEEEEREGVVEGIVRVCRFESLSGLELNKRGVSETPVGALENNIYYRKGKIGDWVNHISPEMGRRLDEITESKFRGTGLSFAKSSTGSGLKEQGNDNNDHACRW